MTRTVPFPVNPAKVLLAGDWHGNTVRATEVIKIAHENGVPVVIQLGDLGFWTPGESTNRYLKAVNEMCKQLGVTLLWVDGNHECHPEINKLPINDEGVRRTRSHILHLPRGFRWNWYGDTWLALGGAHSVDTHMRKEGVSVWQEEHISAEDIRRSVEGGNVDVMVTHDCPDGVEIPGLQSHLFPIHEITRSDEHRKTLAEVVDAVNPLMLFHGHYHVFYRSRRPRPEGGDTLVTGLADDGSNYRDHYVILELEGDTDGD